MARKAAMRTLSSPLDQMARHFWNHLSYARKMNQDKRTFRYNFTAFRLLITYGTTFAVSVKASCSISLSVIRSIKWMAFKKYDRMSFCSALNFGVCVGGLLEEQGSAKVQMNMGGALTICH